MFNIDIKNDELTFTLPDVRKTSQKVFENLLPENLKLAYNNKHSSFSR